ncbi:MAG: alpha-rhamnosidase, partial [Bacteroidales bacterium]
QESATFICSDQRLNKVHDLIKYTLQCLAFSGYMVDCPHLERMGYGGDGNSSTMTLQTMWDVRDTYHNWLTAWEDAMDSIGSLPYVAPAFRTGGGPYWSGFIIKAPWRTYLNYGDRTLIDRHYEQMKLWLSYVDRYSPHGLLEPWPEEGRTWFLGDWLAPTGIEVGGESALFVSNCFIAECLADMKQMALLKGLNADAQQFEARRNRLVADIHQAYFHPESQTYALGTPLDLSYALLQNIPPDSAITQAIREKLLADCHDKYNDHIAVGLMGVPIFTEWAIR